MEAAGVVPQAPPASGDWSLLEVGPGSTGRVFPLAGDEVRLGRHPRTCTVLIEEPSVSREHAVIAPDRDAGGFRVRRLSSSGELLVNGEPVDETALVAGDEITIGSSTFRVVAAQGRGEAL